MCVTAEPVLTASLRPATAAVQIVVSRSDCSYRGLLYSATVYGAGRQAGCGALYSQSSKYGDGFGLFIFCVCV